MLRIKEICKAKGIKLQDLGARMGMPQPTVSVLANGKLKPSYDTLMKLAAALDVRVGELFDDWTDDEIVCPHCGGRISVEVKKGGE